MQVLHNLRIPEINLGQSTITTGISGGFQFMGITTGSIIAIREEIVPELSLKGKAMLSKIGEFSSLEKNWDSYGAEPPIKSVIDKAKRFVRFSDKKRLPLYFTAPGPNGEIVVEFNDKKGKEVEVYFNEDNSIEALFYLNKELIEEREDASYDDILNFLQSDHWIH